MKKTQSEQKTSFIQKLTTLIFSFISLQTVKSTDTKNLPEALIKLETQLPDKTEIKFMVHAYYHFHVVKKSKPNYVYYFNGLGNYNSSNYVDMGAEITYLIQGIYNVYVCTKIPSTTSKF